MGLTNRSMGLNAVDTGLTIIKKNPEDKVIALAGNPNVGKSTVFNGLTGMHQHTGNWPGKTVACAQGYVKNGTKKYVLVDIPGTYSLMAHSAEEEVARNFICFDAPDAVIVVCDATCLERNLNLVLQTIEICPRVLVCVNLMDEAARKHISVDLKKLSKALGVPVISTVAHKKRSLATLVKMLDRIMDNGTGEKALSVKYSSEIEEILPKIQAAIPEEIPISRRFIALQLLQKDALLAKEFSARFGHSLDKATEIADAFLSKKQLTEENIRDQIVFALMHTAETICQSVVTYEKETYNRRDRKIDAFLTGRFTAYPAMILLLLLVFWITISGANYPSALLSDLLFRLQDTLSGFCMRLGVPLWLHGALVEGMYRVLAWVVSVMLPPMAIFFPLFTLLEDIGYLPRIAYNLDEPFSRCNACGKQALTMCMGFGCNAAGVIGCRIIDSPRERLLAILTNNFVPCNGRFPTLIMLITFLLVGGGNSFLSALLLTGAILFGIFMTFLATHLLSKTLLRGFPSSFTLELPPYRRPQICRTLVRSVFDKTIFVLGRAAAVAAPAGLLIWIFANVSIGGASVLSHCAAFLDPFARWMGLDGVLLLAFILGFPANEIVLPIALMAYMSIGTLPQISDMDTIRDILLANGWTYRTALSMMVFSLLHWPCSTTLLTIKKETGSLKWTAVAFLLPTVFGIVICMALNFLLTLLSH